MKNGGFRKVILGMVFLIASSGLWAAEHYKVLNGPKNFYYGHISYIEATPEGKDPIVLREGRLEPEQAVLNLPIGPGDTVRTSADRRCEIQFDTGTIVRLDFNTEVRVETILARSLSSLESLSNLALDKGRVYVMYKEYNRGEMFQVLTPNAAVKMKHNSVAVIAAAGDGSTETQVKYGKARVLFGANEKLLADKDVRKGERLIVQKDDQFQLASAIADTAFELWNKDVNAHFEDLHEGLTSLPKPIQKLPGAVFYFAQTYGSRYGEWLWDDFYGYVWRPFINNGAYPWGWRPYYYGQWSYASGQMFWVPQEPWGWIPYHLGVWQWDKKHGWVWLPGSMFASAWATWDFYFGYACWRPWSLYDWMDGYGPYGMGFFGFSYLDGGWFYNWPYVNDGLGMAGNPGRTIVRKDQLKQPAATAYPVPSELRGTLKRVTAAFRSGDARIRDSASEVPRQLVFVAKGDLKARAVNEKALTWDRVPKSGAPPAKENGLARRPVDPQREAVRAFRGAGAPAAIPQRRDVPAAKPVAGRDPSAVPLAPERLAMLTRRADGPVARFRDWNPDLRVARDLGVSIEYSSARNEVRCPELGISSKDRELAPRFAPHLTSHGVSFGPARSVSPGDSGSFVASGSAGSSAEAGASSRTTGGSEGRESKGSEGGKIKN
jgi:hypothetical protein